MTELEADIKAIESRIDRHINLAIQAGALSEHHRTEIRLLNAERAALVARRSPETVQRLERERGLA